MQIFLTILQNELLISFRNFGKIITNFLFFVMLITIFLLISQGNIYNDSKLFYLITVILFSSLSCIIFSSIEFLKKDFEDGTIEQILTSIDNFEIFILAKTIANWLSYTIPSFIAIILISLFSDLGRENLGQFLTIIFLTTISINFICTFCGSLSTLENSASMISIIALPLIIPILLISYSGFGENDALISIKILFGLAILIGFITIFATAKIIKIAAE